ncbi:hypothetical protein [Belliella pelovolcani]|uniref:Lipocalin-like domain-containing protein n=1 Tax=Belliella pelovolcani TaxID=529505 RepID=A0A1N7JML0_9BACT|nr:hypothetical protein [Belliella pelovolcani]SIS50540.1 hypothetical protein SAMN05421761_101143 [Belliella pelovolcani]
MKNKKIQSVRAWGVGLLFLVLIMMASCQEDAAPDDELRCQVEAIDGSEDEVVGKWKLIKAEILFGNPRNEDYSCDNIIYHYRNDGILRITNNTSDISHGSGEYPYEFIPASLSENGYPILKRANSIWPCHIEKNNMTIYLMALDGPILHFLRTE